MSEPMSEPTADYFSRLLARHAPAMRAVSPVPAGTPGGEHRDGEAALGTSPGASGRPVRVRPRLPGPFERVEALRDPPPGDDGLSPAATPFPAPRPARTDEGTGRRGLREIRTERHTVIRDTPAPPGESPEPERHQLRPETATLRPAPRPLRPVAQPPAAPSASPAGREPVPAQSGAAARGTRPALVAPGEGVVARPAAVRTASADAEAARSARQQAATARRGGPRPSERVVHVQIGRLEVSAATPSGAGGGGAGEAGRQQSGRTAPTVSLDDYLARGRNGERSN